MDCDPGGNSHLQSFLNYMDLFVYMGLFAMPFAVTVRHG